MFRIKHALIISGKIQETNLKKTKFGRRLGAQS